MFHDFFRRAAVSIVSITILVFLFLFAHVLVVQYMISAVVAALAGVALWEYGQLVKMKQGSICLPALIALGVLQTLSFFHTQFALYPLMIFFISFFILALLHFQKTEGAIMDLAASIFALVYIAIPMGMMIGIFSGHLKGQDGRLWVIYLLAVTKVSDIGAYLGGNFWGRRKLAVKISPGKTVEGAVCGLCCSIVVSLGFYLIQYGFYDVQFHLTLSAALLLGTILGCAAQFGDLVESLLKRDAGRKDSNVLPGVGGVLDLIDSLLLNTAILYFYLYHFST